MKTKTIILILLLLLPAIFAKAQYSKNVAFGLLGGVNVQNLYGQDSNGLKLGNELILGYHVGANIQLRITEKFYYQPGLLFSTKGKEKYNNISRTTTNLSYIEMPMNFVYKTRLGNSGYFMIGLGPYIAYAIMGKEKTQVDGETAKKQDIEFRNNVEVDDHLNPYYKALDVGGNVFFGGELAGVFTQLNFQVGVIKINPKYKGVTNDKSSFKNTGFGLSLGYRF